MVIDFGFWISDFGLNGHGNGRAADSRHQPAKDGAIRNPQSCPPSVGRSEIRNEEGL